MKETIVDVLMYLFESYMDEDQDQGTDRDVLRSQLLHAGFERGDIERAFDWLEDLAAVQELPEEPATGSVRLFHPRESEKLNVECQGFLLFLEQSGILSPIIKELVIDRVLALDHEELDIEQLKWVILMVLFSLPEEESSFSALENLVLDEPTTHLN